MTFPYSVIHRLCHHLKRDSSATHRFSWNFFAPTQSTQQRTFKGTLISVKCTYASFGTNSVCWKNRNMSSAWLTTTRQVWNGHVIWTKTKNQQVKHILGVYTNSMSHERSFFKSKSAGVTSEVIDLLPYSCCQNELVHLVMFWICISLIFPVLFSTCYCSP